MGRRVGACAAVVVTLSACARPAPVEPVPPATITDISVAPTGEMAHLVAVRLTGRDDVDEVEFEFADRVPGYTVGYRPLPAHADASGFEIPLPGATALVAIAMTPATGQGWGGGEPTYTGPSTLSADTASVTEIKGAGDFEAVLTWAVGLRATVPFNVRTLDGPPRLLIDFRH